MLRNRLADSRAEIAGDAELHRNLALRELFDQIGSWPR